MPHIFDVPNIVATYGYVGIFVITFLESGTFFALPADSLLFTAGLFAGLGKINIFILMAVIFVGTFSGAIVGYYVGLYLEKLRRFSFFQKLIKDEHLEKTRRFFDRYGKYTILISRFIPIVRTFAPVVAGVIKLDSALFRRYSLLGSFIWATSIPLLGYFFGQVFPEIENYLLIIILGIIFLSFIPLFWEMRKKTNQL